MHRSRFTTALFLAVAAIVAWPGAALAAGERPAAPSTYCGPEGARVHVIVIHGGSFILGDPGMTADTCEAFGNRGWRVTNLSYPLGDLVGAEAALRGAADNARRHSGVTLAYGESAGGGLAALMAARGWVDGAFAWAPVSDLARWKSESRPGFVNWAPFRDSSTATLRRVSAVRWAGRRSAPLMVTHGRDDDLVPVAQSRRLKARWPSMTLREVSGGHLPHEESYIRATETAGRFFQRLLPRTMNRK